MKQYTVILALLSFLLLTLCGCATIKTTCQTKDNLTKIEIGMSKGDLITLMGQPEASEELVTKDGSLVEILKYRTGYKLEGIPIWWPYTPVCVQNKEVIGWGSKFCKNKKRELEFIFP
ncbi:MAG: DUF3192 domain-containing protein [Candidatus Omnitrophota bacterium]